ncbi:MAG: hypothetical protein UH081_06080 [Clostridia bacterium]|nr:hypothetical protein [Clostridia bacterium]
MNKIDKTVLKETKYIACWVLFLSMIAEAVFLIIGKWDYTVLLGNLLSGALVILNFFLMGITVQKAVNKEEKEAKTAMKVSQLYRNLMIIVVTVIGVALKCFNTWIVLIVLFFPRIAVAFRPLFKDDSRT